MRRDMDRAVLYSQPTILAISVAAIPFLPCDIRKIVRK